jgi:phage recombination protein Bet
MTETKEIQKTEEKLPALRTARLPYHPIIKKEFGYDEHAWKALVEAIFPAAQTPESIRLALSYCKARKLDPFKRCIHIVPIWDSNKRCNVDTIWPGIGELRTTAHRTGDYAGRDKTEFGPMKKQKWNNTEVEFPEWAQVTVYRMVKNERVAYAGPQVYWLETYASTKDGSPNSMWSKRPRGQIDKCAEAAALRAAFPEEIGNEYIDAEAHPGTVQRKSFAESQQDAEHKIHSEQGSEPIDTDFEQNGDEPVAGPEEAAARKEEAEKQKAALAKADKPKTPKDQPKPYICDNCNREWEADELKETSKKNAQCPKCLSTKIRRNPALTDNTTPDWANDEEAA